MNNKKSLLCAIGMFACLTSVMFGQAEKVDIGLSAGGSLKGGVFKEGIWDLKLMPADRMVMYFDISPLKAVSNYELLSVELEFRNATFSNKGSNSFMEVSTLEEPFSQYVKKTAQAQQSATNQSSMVLATVELKAEQKDKQTILIPLSIKNKNGIKQGLQNGLMFRWLSASAGSAENLVLPGIRRGSRPIMRITLKPNTVAPKFSLAPSTKPVSGEYVTKKGDHFEYNGQPIRFWGINLTADYKTHSAIDNVVRRVKNMGFNAVRLWSGSGPSIFYTPESASNRSIVKTSQGDGSRLDLYDYMVARLKSEGLFIHNTDLIYFHATKMIKHWPGLPAAIPDSMSHWDYASLPYINDEFLDIRLTHIRNYLNRVNSYTGRKYAEDEVFAIWELAGESQAVIRICEGRFRKWPEVFKRMVWQRWNKWLLEHYENRAGLEKAWGSLDKNEDPAQGTVEPAPSYDQIAKYPLRRGEDFVAFAEDCFIRASKRMRATARVIALQGNGTSIAPFLANSHNNLSLHSQYAHACLDVNSIAAYQAPYTVDKKLPHYPWNPFSSRGPYFYNNNFQSIAGKPMVIYENSYVRPYPYRAEWCPALTFMHAGNGLDGSFLFFFGAPYAVCDENANDLGFLTKPLLIPPDTGAQNVSNGYAQGNDEVAMASTLITGQAFLTGIKENRDVTTITFGRPALQGPRYKLYSANAPAGEHPGGDVGGGEAEWFTMPRIYQKMMYTSISRRLVLAFDIQQKKPVSIEGILMDNDSEDALSPSDDITWDKPRQRIVLDTPYSKIVVGFIRDGHSFKDGICLGPINHDFGMFGIVARDRRPIKDSRVLLLVLTSTSSNAGFEFEPDKIKGSVIGHINGVTNSGHVPIQV